MINKIGYVTSMYDNSIPVTGDLINSCRWTEGYTTIYFTSQGGLILNHGRRCKKRACIKIDEAQSKNPYHAE